MEVKGERLRGARNSEEGQTCSVEDQDGTTQTVNKRITIERQQTRSQRNSDISPIAERRDRSRTNHYVAGDSPGIGRSEGQHEHAKDIKPMLDSGHAPAEGEHEGAGQVEDSVKHVHPYCKVKRLHSLPLTPLLPQPSQRGDNQRFNACLHSWMDDRSEEWAVIRWKCTDRAVPLCLRVHIAIHSPYEPEDRRNMPLGSERSEVLARHRRLGLLHRVGRKMRAKRIAHSFGGIRIIP